MPTDLGAILKLRVPVIVRIAQRQVPLEDVMALGPGAILEMNKSADDELDLMINNKQIGRGEAVKLGENFGIRITLVGSRLERIEAMGG